MRAKLLTLSAIFLILPLYAAFATSFSQIISFGDSLSDNGNAASVAPGHVLPGNYAPNEFTDGLNTMPATSGPLGLWVEQLAPKLGLSAPTPFVAGGQNYAVADALTGHNPAFSLPPSTIIPYTSDQVSIFSAATGGHAPSTALYTLWAGANDINDALVTSPATALGTAKTAADNIAANIQTLAAEGGKYFLWVNLPPLGSTPDGMAAGPAGMLLADTASVIFNTEESADIASLKSMNINVIDVDVYTLFGDIQDHPPRYNLFDIVDPAQGTSGNPNTYLFWDGQHPTTAGDALVADLAANDLAPEPASVGLALIGFCGLLATRKFRRKQA